MTTKKVSTVLEVDVKMLGFPAKAVNIVLHDGEYEEVVIASEDILPESTEGETVPPAIDQAIDVLELMIARLKYLKTLPEPQYQHTVSHANEITEYPVR